MQPHPYFFILKLKKFSNDKYELLIIFLFKGNNFNNLNFDWINSKKQICHKRLYHFKTNRTF